MEDRNRDGIPDIFEKLGRESLVDTFRVEAEKPSVDGRLSVFVQESRRSCLQRVDPPWRLLMRSQTVPTRSFAAVAMALLAFGCNQPRTPVVLSDELEEPLVLAVDAAFVYWLQADGVVAKVPRAGGTPVELGARLEVDPPEGTVPLRHTDGFSLAIDATSAYFTTYCLGTGTLCTGVVWKVALGGGTPVALKKYVAEVAYLAIDDTRVYVVHSNRSLGLGGLECTT